MKYVCWRCGGHVVRNKHSDQICHTIQLQHACESIMDRGLYAELPAPLCARLSSLSAEQHKAFGIERVRLPNPICGYRDSALGIPKWLADYWWYLVDTELNKTRHTASKGRRQRRRPFSAVYKHTERRAWVILMNNLNHWNQKGYSFADEVKGLLGLKQLQEITL